MIDNRFLSQVTITIDAENATISEIPSEHAIEHAGSNNPQRQS
jgi:hypothetical protein